MASAAAALAARARREIQHRFFAADAVRPDRAIAFTPDNRFEERQLERLLDRHVVCEDMAGRYWLDLPAYDALIRERHNRVRAALIVVAVLLALFMVGAGLLAAQQSEASGAQEPAALPPGDAR